MSNLKVGDVCRFVKSFCTPYVTDNSILRITKIGGSGYSQYPYVCELLFGEWVYGSPEQYNYFGAKELEKIHDP